MKYLKNIKILLFIIVFLPLFIYGETKKTNSDHIIKKEDSFINWSKLTITTVGNGAFPFFTENYEVARLKSEKTAEINACNKIYRAFTQIIFSEKETIDSLLKSNEDRSKLKDTICSRIIKTDTQTFSDGSSDIYFSFDMDVVLKSFSNFVVPEEMVTSTESFEGNEPLLVIKIPKKTKYEPALFPKIISKSGQIIYSYPLLNSEIRNRGISVKYYRDINIIKDKKYIKINSVEIKNKTDIVISDKDLDLLKKSLSSDTLKKGDVVIINN